MSIEVNKVVNVTIASSQTFPARKGFGVLNIIGISSRLPVGNRSRVYGSMDGVAADFQSTDEEYKAAQVVFSQSPRPVSIMISRRFNAAVPGELLGSVGYDKDLAHYTAITNGGFDIPIDGANKQVTAINFTGVASFNAAAALIQTRLQVVAVGATCTFDGTRFIIRSGTTGIASTVGYAVTPTGAGSPVSIGTLLGLTAADKGVVTPGSAIETLATSLDKLQDLSQSWYGFMFTNEVTEAQIKEAAAWAEARVKIFGFTTKASNVLDPAVTADIGSFMKSNLYNRTFWVWDDNDDYMIASAFARAFTVNFNEQNSTITLKFKQLPGTTPSVITETQRLAIVAKKGNYYTTFGDSIMFAEGWMASGQFFDERHGLDWLQNAAETEVFGYLMTRTTKVPQTDKGVAAIVSVLEQVMNEAVRNGLAAPGQWNGFDLGEISSGDYLPKGFYVYAQPVADQPQSEREQRKAPPIQIIMKGAGAIHFVDVSITFER
jgi:hypothetical protein